MKKMMLCIGIGLALGMVACNKQDNTIQNSEKRTRSTAMRAGASHNRVSDDKDCEEVEGNCSGEVIVINKKYCENLNAAIDHGPTAVQDFFNDPRLDETFKAYWDPADLKGLQDGTVFVTMVHNPTTKFYFYFVGTTPQVSAEDFDFVYQFVY